MHVEPRLIAPFALLMALGMLWWRFDPEVSRPDGGLATSAVAVPRSWPVLSALGLLVAVPFVAVTLRDQIRLTAGLDRRLVEIDRLHATAAAAGFRLDRIGIVGPALPHLADAWRVGGRIVAQVPPASAEALSRLPAERVRAFLVAAFAGRADAAWVNTGGDAFQMLEVDGPVRPAGSVAPPDR